MNSSCSLLSTNGHGHSSLAVARQLACPGQTLAAADPASRMDLCAGRFRECECVVRLMGPADAWPRSSLKIILSDYTQGKGAAEQFAQELHCKSMQLCAC